MHGESPNTVRCFVLTISDSRTPTTDESGSLAKSLIERSGHPVVAYQIVRDEPQQIRAAILAHVRSPKVDAVFATGGTGLSNRDQTFETVSKLIERPMPGFGELFRVLSFEEVGPRAMFSRATAGMVRGKPVFAMPGSPPAVRLALTRLILPELGHLAYQMTARTPHHSSTAGR